MTEEQYIQLQTNVLIYGIGLVRWVNTPTGVPSVDVVAPQGYYDLSEHLKWVDQNSIGLQIGIKRASEK